MRRAPAGGGPPPPRPAPRPPGAPKSPHPPAMEADGVWKAPGRHPPTLRTFPHPLEILGARPPPAQDSHSSHSRDGEVGKETKRREKMTDSEAVIGPQGGHFDPP